MVPSRPPMLKGGGPAQVMYYGRPLSARLQMRDKPSWSSEGGFQLRPSCGVPAPISLLVAGIH
jgi:hypothetical protein